MDFYLTDSGRDHTKVNLGSLVLLGFGVFVCFSFLTEGEDLVLLFIETYKKRIPLRMFFLHFQFSQLKDTVKQKHITISIKKK